MPARKPLPPLLKKAALIPVGLAVGVLLAFGGVHLWDAVATGPTQITSQDHDHLRAMLDDDRSNRGLYLFDKTLGYRFKPNYRGVRHKSESEPHRTNSMGLLGSREISADDTRPRVLFLGDSVTYGDSLPFVSIFSSLVEQLSEGSISCFNGACPGWNMRQHLAYFDQHLSEQSWELVVLAICLNDFVEFGWSGSSETGYQWMITERLTTWERWELSSLKGDFANSDTLAPLERQDDATLLAWQDGRVSQTLESLLLSRLKNNDLPQAVILVLPTQGQLESLARGGEASVVKAPQLVIQKFCEEQKISFLDASDWLQQSSPQEVQQWYLDNDQLHFGEKGHIRLAERLWKELKSLLSMK